MRSLHALCVRRVRSQDSTSTRNGNRMETPGARRVRTSDRSNFVIRAMETADGAPMDGLWRLAAVRTKRPEAGIACRKPEVQWISPEWRRARGLGVHHWEQVLKLGRRADKMGVGVVECGAAGAHLRVDSRACGHCTPATSRRRELPMH